MERPRHRSRDINDKRDNGASEPLLPPSSTIILQNIGLDMTERKVLALKNYNTFIVNFISDLKVQSRTKIIPRKISLFIVYLLYCIINKCL